MNDNIKNKDEDLESRSFIKKVKDVFTDIFTIKTDIARYEESLSNIALDMVDLNEKNLQLKTEIFELKQDNKRLNALILEKKDLLE